MPVDSDSEVQQHCESKTKSEQTNIQVSNSAVIYLNLDDDMSFIQLTVIIPLDFHIINHLEKYSILKLCCSMDHIIFIKV